MKIGWVKQLISKHLAFHNSGMAQKCERFKNFGIPMLNGNCQYIVLVQYAIVCFEHSQQNVLKC